MKRLLELVFNRWTLIAGLLLASSLTLWLFGPLVMLGDWRPLDTARARLMSILGLCVVVALWIAVSSWKSRSRNQTVVKALVADSPQPSESADITAVRERFERALLTLQKAKFGEGGLASGWIAKTSGRYLYELPWYLIIGAPASGKTTALRHSGLKFPVADARAASPSLRGVGGTRNCDWFFTDSAVLIDTAGRLTTQDSDPRGDRETWTAFLKLLKRTRARQPINGVLVTVSVVDLFNRDLAQRAEHAGAIRKRLQELQEQLRVRFPIYLLVTKCDLMSGFMETFGSVDKEVRATPWGFTFSSDGDGHDNSDLAQIRPHLSALHQRLNDGLVDRLQTESDLQRRARIYGFPAQFAALGPLLTDFAEQVFMPSPYEANPMLRGVYFISGTQEGMPFDRLLGQVARQYQLERAVFPAHSGTGKAFFLERLLREVVFAEAGLAGTNRQWERRRALGATLGYVGVGMVAVGFLVAWGWSWRNNRHYVAEVARVTEEVSHQVANAPNRADSALRPLLPALEATRKLALTGPAAMAGDACKGDVPWTLGFGLYQGCRLDQAASAAYERMLQDALQPRLALRIEEQLRQGDPKGSLYEALKTYLMLFEPARFQREALRQHVQQDWDARLSGELSPEERKQLDGHLDTLLALGATIRPVRPADKALIEQSRQRLATIPLPQRIYDRIRRQGLGKDLPEFSVASKAGPQAALAFVRSNNQPLTSGVPGLYSFDGYHKGFQERVNEVTKELASEQAWVLGVSDAAAVSALDPANLLRGGNALEDQVRRLYLNEYAAAWESFIAGIKLRPAASVAESTQLARVLAAPDSPMLPLLRAIVRETTLLAPREGLPAAAGNVLDKAREKVNSALGSRPVLTSGAPADRIESIVDSRFSGLRTLVTAPEGGRAPIEGVLSRIGELHVYLNAVQSALSGKVTPPSSPLPNQLKSDAQTLPEPVRSLLDTLGQGSAHMAQRQVRDALGGEVRSQIGEFCSRAIAGRYPFDRGAATEVTPQDFAALFGPGGKFDQVLQQKLAAYVDTSTRPWTFRRVEGVPLGVDSGTLPQFQNALAIKETFFAGGGAAPSMRLEFRPVEMDAAISQITINIDGQVVRYAHGPLIPATVQWPGQGGTGQVRVEVSPSGTGIVTTGAWAIFRLFDRVRTEPGRTPERFKAVFDFEGRKAVFEVIASSVRNPFQLGELKGFLCPQGL